MEDQDYDAVANAQIEIGRLGAEQSQYEQMKAQQEVRAKAPKQEREVEIPKAPQQQPVKDPKAEVWASENEWFGTDKVMTNVAYAIHEDLVNQGVDPRTDYYYSEIDKRMRKIFLISLNKILHPKNPHANSPSRLWQAHIETEAQDAT
jgi:hypothetical protein